MASEWPIVKLGDICDKIGSGATPKGGKDAYCSEGISLIRSQNVLDFEFSDDGLAYINDEQARKLNNVEVKSGDVLLNITGDSVARVCVVEDSFLPARVNQHVAIVRGNAKKVICSYLLYFLQMEKPHLLQLASAGATRNALTKGMIEQLELAIPPLDVQRRMVAILDALQQKIHTNNKINDNLYEILQSVFQSRFGLSEESARVGTLSEICAYSKDRVAVSKLGVKNYYSTENMLPSKAGSVDAASLPTTQQTTKCNIGDVLVSNIRPYFKKIVYCQSEGGCSTDVLCFTPKLPSLSSYLFCTLYADSFFNYMVAGSKGTKMPRGDKLQIMTYPVVIPTEDELRAFDEVAQPILRQIHINSDENTYLAALRDTLLPKLMSGEIDVSDIQR